MWEAGKHRKHKIVIASRVVQDFPQNCWPSVSYVRKIFARMLSKFWAALSQGFSLTSFVSVFLQACMHNSQIVCDTIVKSLWTRNGRDNRRIVIALYALCNRITIPLHLPRKSGSSIRLRAMNGGTLLPLSIWAFILGWNLRATQTQSTTHSLCPTRTHQWYWEQMRFSVLSGMLIYMARTTCAVTPAHLRHLCQNWPHSCPLPRGLDHPEKTTRFAYLSLPLV